MNRSERRASQFGHFTPLRQNHQPDSTHGRALGLGLGIEIELAWSEYCGKSGPETDHLWEGVVSEVPAITPGPSDPRWS